MKLSAINWDTLTEAQARRLIGPADSHEKAKAREFDAGKCTESEWLAAFTLWEDLRVYALCGEKPSKGVTP